MRPALLLATPVLVVGGPASAQTLTGAVLLPDGATPARAVVVVATDARGAAIAQALTDDRGAFRVALPGPGTYGVRALRIGFRPTVVAARAVGAGETVAVRVVLDGANVALPAVAVRGRSSCGLRRDADPTVLALWEQARTALTASLLSGQAGLDARWVQFERQLDRSGTRVLDERWSERSGVTLRPFVSEPIERLVRDGYVIETLEGAIYRAPDERALLSDLFVETHCFHTQPPPADRPTWVGIGFRPTRERAGRPDIEGTVWLDRATAELQRLDFTYVGRSGDAATAPAGGTVAFARLDGGLWVIPSWEIRMPLVRRQRYTDPLRGLVIRPEAYGIAVSGGEIVSLRRGGATLFATGREWRRTDVPAAAAADELYFDPCPAAARQDRDRTGTLIGRVTADGAPAGGAAVEVSWRHSYRVLSGGSAFSWQTSRHTATTPPHGRWRVCSVPRERPVDVVATRAGRRAALEVRLGRDQATATVDLELVPGGGGRR